MLDLTISIVNYNATLHLEKCLSTFFAMTKDISYEVIVVDNASTDGSLEMLKRFPQVDVIINRENLFFVKAQNQVLRLAKGRYCVILNPDVYFEENALKKCVDFMDQHPEVGVVGPKILNPNGTYQGSGDRFPTFMYGLFEVLLLNTLWKNNPVRSYRIQSGWKRDNTMAVNSLGGACLVVRSSILEQVGFLDENLLMYWEEVDWCKRIREAGYEIYFLAETSVVHIGSQSADLLGGKEKDRIFYGSMLTYYKKHYGNLVAFLFEVILYLYTKPILQFFRFLKISSKFFSI